MLRWNQLLCSELPTLSFASGLRIISASCAMAPVSTTVWASSGVCLQISLRVEAAMRLRANSGSLRHSTSRGTAPASTMHCDSAANEKLHVKDEPRKWDVLKKSSWNAEPLIVSLLYMHCVWQCCPEPRQQPLSPQGQTPPDREPGRPPPHRPPRSETAEGSVWLLHAAQKLLLSCRTSAHKHTHISCHGSAKYEDLTHITLLLKKKHSAVILFCN